MRDHDGKLFSTASVLLLDVSALLAQMIAAWNAIKAAIFRIGATKLWIERDALRIILAIKKGSEVGRYTINLLQTHRTLAPES